MTNLWVLQRQIATFGELLCLLKCEHRLFCSTIPRDVRNMVGYAYCFILHNTDFCDIQEISHLKIPLLINFSTIQHHVPSNIKKPRHWNPSRNSNNILWYLVIYEIHMRLLALWKQFYQDCIRSVILQCDSVLVFSVRKQCLFGDFSSALK